MTKRERAQVVELLRCVADGSLCRHVRRYEPWGCVSQRIHDLSLRAWQSVDNLDGISLLEAAQRVEDGEWP